MRRVSARQGESPHLSVWHPQPRPYRRFALLLHDGQFSLVAPLNLAPMTLSFPISPPAIVAPAAPCISLLEGRCNGRLMGRWADNLARRHGEDAVRTVRSALGPLSHALPDAPCKADWIPVAAQLRATEILLERFHGGDPESLYAEAYRDTVAMLPPGTRLALRGVGLRRAIAKAPGIHRRLYDVGRVAADVERRSARLTFRDAEMFAHPIWQMLQEFAVRVLFQLCGKRPKALAGREVGRAGYELSLAW